MLIYSCNMFDYKAFFVTSHPFLEKYSFAGLIKLSNLL